MWTNIAKPTTSNWTSIAKPSARFTINIGYATGVLGPPTYSKQIVITNWTSLPKPSTSNWINIPKPT